MSWNKNFNTNYSIGCPSSLSRTKIFNRFCSFVQRLSYKTPTRNFIWRCLSNGLLRDRLASLSISTPVEKSNNFRNGREQALLADKLVVCWIFSISLSFTTIFIRIGICESHLKMMLVTWSGSKAAIVCTQELCDQMCIIAHTIPVFNCNAKHFE